jgi:hypothetical protein
MVGANTADSTNLDLYLLTKDIAATLAKGRI